MAVGGAGGGHGGATGGGGPGHERLVPCGGGGGNRGGHVPARPGGREHGHAGAAPAQVGRGWEAAGNATTSGEARGTGRGGQRRWRRDRKRSATEDRARGRNDRCERSQVGGAERERAIAGATAAETRSPVAEGASNEYEYETTDVYLYLRG